MAGQEGKPAPCGGHWGRAEGVVNSQVAGWGEYS